MQTTGRATRDAVVAAANGLGLPAIVLTIVRGVPPPRPIDLFFGIAEEFYLSSAEVQASLGAPSLLPLWDDGNFGTVTAIHLPTKRFVCFSVESCVHPDELPRLSFQQALIQPFVRMWESELVDDSFSEIAQLFDFRFAEEIRASYGQPNRDHERWLAGLMHAAA